MIHVPNPNGLRVLSVPIFGYLFYYTLTHEPPWPKWLIVLAFLATYLSYSTYRAEKRLNAYKNEIYKEKDSGFNFEIPNFSKKVNFDDLKKEDN